MLDTLDTARAFKMYRPATTRVNQEPAEPPAFVEAGDDDVEAVGAEQQQQQQPQQATEGVQHLNTAMFTNFQKALLDFDVTCSLADLQQDQSKRTWALAPQLQAQLKQNLATKNRHRAADDQLAGNLQRGIVLGFRILQQANTFPVSMCVRIPGMMEQNLHKDGQALWRIPPNTPTQSLGAPYEAYEPTNPITADMYANFRSCTLEDLEHDIRQEKHGKNVYATVAVGTMAYDWLVKNLIETNVWDGELDEERTNLVLNPPKSLKRVEVTPRIATDLYGMMSGPAKEISESFTNLADLVAYFARADDSNGNFMSPKSVNGFIGSNAVVDGDKMLDVMMQTQHTFHIKAELSYVTF